MTGNGKQQRSGSKGATLGLAVFAVYVVVLALAAVSELFGLGWFNHPLFK